MWYDYINLSAAVNIVGLGGVFNMWIDFHYGALEQPSATCL